MEDKEFSSDSLFALDTAKIPKLFNVGLALLVIIAALISFGEITFSAGDIRDLSLLAVVIYVISTLVYRNNYTGGINKGKTLPEYTEAKAAYDAAKAEVMKHDVLPKLPELCVEYCREELKQYRASILSQACITYEDYASKYINKDEAELKTLGLPDSAIKIVFKAGKAKAKHLDPNALLSENGSRVIFGRILLGVSSKARENFDFGFNALSRALITLLSVVVAVTIFFDFNIETFATWGVRMLPVLWSALTSTAAGIKNVLYTLIPQMHRKTEILKAIIAMHEKRGVLSEKVGTKVGTEF